MGNTKKLGAMLGILKAIGAYVPEPGSVMWTAFMLVQRIFTTVFGASPPSRRRPTQQALRLLGVVAR